MRNNTSDRKTWYLPIETSFHSLIIDNLMIPITNGLAITRKHEQFLGGSISHFDSLFESSFDLKNPEIETKQSKGRVYSIKKDMHPTNLASLLDVSDLFLHFTLSQVIEICRLHPYLIDSDKGALIFVVKRANLDLAIVTIHGNDGFGIMATLNRFDNTNNRIKKGSRLVVPSRSYYYE